MDKTGCTVEPQKVDCQVEGRFLEVATAWGETEKLDEEVHEIEERSSEEWDGVHDEVCERAIGQAEWEECPA